MTAAAGITVATSIRALPFVVRVNVRVDRRDLRGGFLEGVGVVVLPVEAVIRRVEAEDPCRRPGGAAGVMVEPRGVDGERGTRGPLVADGRPRGSGPARRGTCPRRPPGCCGRLLEVLVVCIPSLKKTSCGPGRGTARGRSGPARRRGVAQDQLAGCGSGLRSDRVMWVCPFVHVQRVAVGARLLGGGRDAASSPGRRR